MKRILSLLLVCAVLVSGLLIPVSAEVPEYTTAQYGLIGSAAVLTEDRPVQFTLTTYDNNWENDQIWMAITVEDDDQAMEFTFSGIKEYINYYLFNAAAAEENGLNNNNLIQSESCVKPSTLSFKVAAKGVYYLMVRPWTDSCVCQEPYTVSLKLIDGDSNESSGEFNNDSWEHATELTENVNTYYTLNGDNDVDWFKITTTVPGQAVKIILSNFNYTVSQIHAYLYSQEDIENDKWDTVMKKERIDTDTSFNYKVSEPGTYYLKLFMSYNNTYVTRPLKVRYETVSGDTYENNDTWQTATNIPQDDYEMEFSLNGENDVDWFYFETSEVNEVVKLTIRDFETDYSNNIYYYVYDIDESTEDKDEIKHGEYINKQYTASFSCEKPGGHYIKIGNQYSASVENKLKLKISRSTLLIDECEPNDTWQTATPITADVSQTFNLPTSTDVDWFVFSTDEPNQTVEFSIRVPLGGSIYRELYSYEDLEAEDTDAYRMERWGYGSGAGLFTYRYTIKNEGEYYLKVSVSDGQVFEENATLTYTLIPPDEYEYNNTWQTASALEEGVEEAFTLPANNDVDFFKFSTEKPDQTVEFTITVPAGGSIYRELYSKTDFEEQGDDAYRMERWGYGSGAGQFTYRYTLENEGEYYLKVSVYDGKVFDEEGTITYRLIEPDEYENNNTWKNATAMNEGVGYKFSLSGDNDSDWFKVSVPDENQTVEFTITVPEGGSIYRELFSKADFEEQGDGAYRMERWGYGSGAGQFTYRYTLEDSGDYFIKLTTYDGKVFDTDGTVTYRLIAPDAYENNNTWDKAVELAPQTTVSVTVPADNDNDWFKVADVTPGDKIRVFMGNIPNNGCIYKTIYCKGEYDAEPCQKNSAYMQSSVTFCYSDYTVEDEGEYYIRLTHNSGSYDNVYTMRYIIIRDDISVDSVSISSIGNAGTTMFQGKTLELYAITDPINATNQNVTWTSSNTGVATIDSNGLVTAIAPGKTTITVITEDGSRQASTEITVVEPIPVTGVTVTCNDVEKKGETEENPKNLSLDTTLRLSYGILPETATEQAVTWSVSDPEVLSVTDYGRVCAVGSGSAYVTVTTVEGGFTAKFYIYVPDESYPVTKITLDKATMTLYMGEEGSPLTATVYPSYATNPSVNWFSADESIATVDSNGVVTPVAVGYTTITAKSEENGAISRTCDICVLPQRTRVTSASFTQETLDVGIYAEIDLKPFLEVLPIDATDRSVTWSISDKTKATVSRTGILTTLNVGRTVVTATTEDGAFEAKLTINIAPTAQMGDINNDGVTDAGDVLMILQYTVGLRAMTEAQQLLADVNGDGSVDVGDAILVLRYDAGLISEFPNKAAGGK